MRSQVVKDLEKDFLEPSFRYLVENGLENTSVRDLCKAMDISYGSLYYWFEGKDDIYTSVIKYGIGKVAGKLFDFAFDTMQQPDVFFDSFLEEAAKHKAELRTICQFATSPKYGKATREKAEEFVAVYDKHINKLSDILGITPEKVAPIIYMLISILIDFVVWEDRAASDMQMKFLYKIMTEMI